MKAGFKRKSELGSGSIETSDRPMVSRLPKGRTALSIRCPRQNVPLRLPNRRTAMPSRRGEFNVLARNRLIIHDEIDVIARAHFARTGEKLELPHATVVASNSNDCTQRGKGPRPFECGRTVVPRNWRGTAR